jgi:hypothetical protein
LVLPSVRTTRIQRHKRGADVMHNNVSSVTRSEANVCDLKRAVHVVHSCWRKHAFGLA